MPMAPKNSATSRLASTKLTARFSLRLASTQFSRSPAATKSTRISRAHDTDTIGAEVSSRSSLDRVAPMSPTSWPDRSTEATCTPAFSSSLMLDSTKVDTSLTIDIGGERVDSVEALMRTLHLARSHDGGDTSEV